MLGAVRCTVEECVYNKSLHCSAESILIKVDGNDTVGTSRGTRCDTFSYKGSPQHASGQS